MDDAVGDRCEGFRKTFYAGCKTGCTAKGCAAAGKIGCAIASIHLFKSKCLFIFKCSFLLSALVRQNTLRYPRA